MVYGSSRVLFMWILRLSPDEMEVMESKLPSLKEVCVTSARAVPMGELDADAEEELEEVDL